MRQTLEFINGEWKWCDNPMLEEAMKQPHILQEGEEIEYSDISTEEMIARGAVPVKDIIEQVYRNHGLSLSDLITDSEENADDQKK